MKRGVLLVLFGMLLGGGTVFAAFHWHFVRADDGWHVVTNRHSSLGDCYADVRDWTATEWTDHPQLATALVDAGKEDIVIQTSANGLIDRFMNRR